MYQEDQQRVNTNAKKLEGGLEKQQYHIHKVFM
jgi:hypothetical protein